MEGLPPEVDDGPEGIAIIGMSGRFPGAGNVPDFWANLCAGVDSISRFSGAELEDGLDAAARAAPDYVPARGVLPDIEGFDAGFFGMRAREAAVTDPQHRLFLEVVWEAIEDAGHDPGGLAGLPVGVFAGCSMPTYFLHHLLPDRAAINAFTDTFQVGNYPLLVGALGDTLATRVSYKLDLRGPSMTIQTACSTSLVAVAQAVQSLLLHQCDMAVAGGVSVTFPQRRGYLAQQGGMVSPDGRCRPFDAAADGTVFSHGCGAVLLRRLSEAVADGDHVYAVIRGAAVNNDGAGKVGFTAPSVDAQAEAVATAQMVAGFDPRSIGHIECHGTGTSLGDPIEVAGLARAFAGGTSDKGFCALGSVKGNVGHLDAAAGVTGLIKAALCVHHGLLPPTAHFRTPNPMLPLDGSPFFVQAELGPWPEPGRVRRAGVSALGIGGTNAHAVLEEAPPPAPSGPAGAQEILVLSARSEAALGVARGALAARLRTAPDLSLADVAHTLQTGRRAFSHRWAVAAGSRDAALAALDGGGGTTDAAPAGGRPVVFLFPGQGAQHAGMGGGPHRDEPAYREAFGRCADILCPHLGVDLRDALYGAGDPHALERTLLAQPAIFAVEYALAQLWLSWGVRPAALAGHSVGELVAATVAGVFTLEDALALIAERGRLMQAQPGGAMLAVRLSEAALLPLLGDGVDLAAVNSPSVCVAAGPEDAVARLEAVLHARGAQAQRLRTSHAFHSAMMDPVVAPLIEAVRRMPLAPPRVPWVSSVTGRWITPEEATSPEYWGRHCRAEVRFAEAMTTLVGSFAAGDGLVPDGPTLSAAPALLEVGPGATLVTLARQGAARGTPVVTVASLPDGRTGQDDDALHAAAARLWVAGAALDWPAIRQGAARRRVPLPTYPFERARHWVDAPAAASPPIAASIPTEVHAMLDTRTVAAQQAVVELIEELAGEPMPAADAGVSFLELGYDSLFLSQLAQAVQGRFGVRISFRQLLRELGTLPTLAEHLAPHLPAGDERQAPAPALDTTPVAPSGPPPARPLASAALATSGGSGLEALMRAQVEAMSGLMAAQLETLRAAGQVGAATPAAVAGPVAASAAAPPVATAATVQAPSPSNPAASAEMESRFGRFSQAAKPIASALTPAQQALVSELTARFTARTPTSRAMTQEHRRVLADPRAAAGFRSEWKELVYPLVCDRAEGARIWDVDGNAYIDLVNGYGVTALGHGPQFVLDAVAAQLSRGFAIGPQSDLAGRVAAGISDLTGDERVSFTCTGSEAVMAALRVARAVTGRDRVVAFAGAYHGGFDEVLARGVRQGGRPVAKPAAAGITEAAVANLTILEYADPASLEWIRDHAQDLAAVLVEPVQSRHPALQPRDFLHALRGITEASGTALIFDEVVTGFRLHPGGAQALFDVRADLATYGKVLGGGLPIGVLTGKARFMDALDGGHWSFGDDSVPEVAVTVFAGTFVRHPLALAAAAAVIDHLKAEGPALQARLDDATWGLVQRLDALFARRGLRLRAERGGSMFFLNPAAEDRRASLLFPLLRDRGIHVQENFPCFLTTAHGPAEVDAIVAAFDGALGDLQRVGILAPQEPAPQDAGATPLASPPPAIRLTEPQMEVWLAAQLGDAASCAFNEGVRLDLDGPLDVPALRQALERTVARHESLRSRVSATGESMSFAPPSAMPLPEDDLSALSEPARAAAVEVAMAAAAETPFDLTAGPPIHARLLRRGPAAHTLLLSAHHIACDGWSMNAVINEVAAQYGAVRAGTGAALPAALSFAAQAQEAGSDTVAAAHWQARFAAPPPPLELPSDRPRPARKSFRGATLATHVDAALVRKVRAAGGRHGATLFATLLAAFQALVGRLARQEEVVVAVPMAGQLGLPGGTLVGHCVNLLPIRGRWDGATTFAGHLAAVQEELASAREHQACTLGTLVRALDLPRDPGRLPLADVQFNLERLARPADFGGLRVETATIGKAFVNFDLFVNAIESDDGLRIECDYSTDLFDAATVRRWLGHYETLLAALAEDPQQRVVTAPLLRPAELQALVAAGAGPVRPLPPGAGFHALFEAQAAAHPGRIAVTSGEVAWSYAELDARANALAVRLRQGIPGPAARVGVLLDRSPELLAALLAVAKAGFTYVPLDPGHPPERLRRIAERADLAAFIADRAAPEGLDVPVVSPRQHAPAPGAEASVLPLVAARGPAYLIFTSGSTGEPKGVEVGHPALVNLLAAMAQEPGFGSGDTLLAVTTVAFDIAALELFLPLTVGGRVIIAPAAEAVDGFALLRLLQDGVTALQATPATWRLLLEAGFRGRPGLRMLCGGEALTRELADRLLEGGGELWNLYGPTETTIWSACARIVADGAPITIGQPIANTDLHVLDRHAQRMPPGATGELWIGGAGLADGYFRNPALTAERFRPDPFGPASPDGSRGRIYGTGDLARWAPGVGLEVVGRQDAQVKLRGFRIELGEVEAAIAGLPGVAAAAVALRSDPPGPRLVGYVVSRPGHAVEGAALQAALRRSLPGYMVPMAWVQMESLPLTPNRKLDRAALPAGPCTPASAPSAASLGPVEAPVAARISAIVSAVLKLSAVGNEDDLVELGADSIQLFQIAARAQREGLPLAARHLLEHPTIASLARAIANAAPAAAAPSLADFRRGRAA